MVFRNETLCGVYRGQSWQTGNHPCFLLAKFAGGDIDNESNL